MELTGYSIHAFNSYSTFYSAYNEVTKDQPTDMKSLMLKSV